MRRRLSLVRRPARPVQRGFERSGGPAEELDAFVGKFRWEMLPPAKTQSSVTKV